MAPIFFFNLKNDSDGWDGHNLKGEFISIVHKTTHALYASCPLAILRPLSQPQAKTISQHLPNFDP